MHNLHLAAVLNKIRVVLDVTTKRKGEVPSFFDIFEKKQRQSRQTVDAIVLPVIAPFSCC